MASAATGGTNDEHVVIAFPEPGTYTVRFIDYDQVDDAAPDDWTANLSFEGPTPAVPGVTESWTLTCTRADGAATTPQQVEVARGGKADVGQVCAAR